jgi:anti-sigma factor RsiW
MSQRDVRSDVLDEELSALLDGELGPARQAELRELLARSPEVAARLDALRRVDAALRGIPEREVPGDLLARVHLQGERTPASEVGGRGPRRRRRWLAPAGGLAAASTAAALALWLAPGAGREVPEEIDLAQLSDEEIALVIDLDTLEDLELIENLDLLEQLEALEAGRG